MNNKGWLVQATLRCGPSLESSEEIHLSVGSPYVSMEKKGYSEWSCDFSISGLIEHSHKNTEFSNFSALLSAMQGVRHSLRLKLEMEGWKLYSYMHDINKFEEADLETVFCVDDCIPEDYEYVVNMAKKKGISLDD